MNATTPNGTSSTPDEREAVEARAARSFFGHPALRLLLWLKIRAIFRTQVRRLRTPRSWIFLILGVVLGIGWLGMMLVGSAQQRSSRSVIEPHALEPVVQVGLLVMVLLSLVSAFGHRGLFLPSDEIERCFSSPVARTDLVRYRLSSNLVRSIFASLLFGAASLRWVPNPVCGFVGTLLTLFSIPILGQATAILLGDAENRIGRLGQKLPLAQIGRVLTIVVVLGLLASIFRVASSMDDAYELRSERMSLVAELRRPWVQALLLPLLPWARMITSETLLEFLPWFGLCVGIALLGFEATARIRVDYRELSLATSADVARRLNRLRRGGVGSSEVRRKKNAFGWSVPWLFGEGAFGAVAWMQTCAMVRKARGTLIVSALILGGLTTLAALTDDDAGDDARLRSLVLTSVMGTVYLGAGLRFDFRGQLDAMEHIKAWPLRPAKLFLAMIAGEVALVSGMIVLAVLARALWSGGSPTFVAAIVCFQPLVVLTWVALDNAVFLYAPVRHTPGQEGALQHMGRSIVLLLLRMFVLIVVVGVAILPALLVGWGLIAGLQVDEDLAHAIAGGTAWLGLAAVDFALLMIGGWLLSRFDVARDRGQ